MASSSSSSSLSRIRRFHVFTSFHGPDVRRGFLSHLHSHFKSRGITTFKDQEIERGHTIGPELVKAIRESRVSIVVLSKNYVSSSCCLDELVEILKCKEALGQIVMTIFYDVDPSDVRKQRGDFGNAFEKTCQGKTEEEKQRWIEALTCVATIAGEHSLHWFDYSAFYQSEEVVNFFLVIFNSPRYFVRPSEAEMIKQICTNVSKKLHGTLSRDFQGMVGLEAHLAELELCLECDEAKMIGICGPPGIGKTTIARVLFKQLFTDFPLSCFMGNLKGVIGVDDDYESSKLRLQNQLMSKILNNFGGMGRHTLGAIKEWLKDQRVLIILDDVDDLDKLKVLARALSWFGSGSRIIVTTEDKKILTEHGINNIYHMECPSEKEALQILCLSAFKQITPRVGFEKLAKKVAKACGNLPLRLRVVGSSLCGEDIDEWKLKLSSVIETGLLRVGYDRLSKQNQSLFLHIACFFNNEVVGYVESILSDGPTGNDVRKGLKTLTDKSLVDIYDGRIAMHYLLQQLGRQIVLEQSNEPGERQFLEDAKEIHDVLTNKTGTESVIGISFNMSKIGKFSISQGAIERMCNLQFLKIYGVKATTLQIPESMNCPPRLRLLDWDSYPSTFLPEAFQPEHLVELHMQRSNLEELWRGSKPLPNLKTIDMSYSSRLKEIPDISNATNLETLTLTFCTSLVELPSSIKNLHKLKKLMMRSCVELRVIPTNINLTSLEEVDMSYCSQLKIFPDVSSNIKTLRVRDTKIKYVPESIVGRWSHLECLEIGSRRLKSLTHIPKCVTSLDLSNSRIESIPDCVRGLKHLIVQNCTKLKSIPALPSPLESLNANDCVSLKTVLFSFHNPMKVLTFYNCLNLDKESRRRIIQQSVHEYICLPGKEVPAEFTYKATGHSITISSGIFSASSRFKACFMLSPIKHHRFLTISCRLRSRGGVTINNFCSSALLSDTSPLSEHLFVFRGDLFDQRNRCLEVDVARSEITFEFSCWYNDDKITECGVQILAEEAESNSSSKMDNFETESSSIEVDDYETGGNNNRHADGDGDYEVETFMVSQGEKIKATKHTSCWIWLEKLGLKKMKNKMKNKFYRCLALSYKKFYSCLKSPQSSLTKPLDAP